MRILLNDNIPFPTENLTSESVSDLKFCILDYSGKNDIDFYFIPVVFLETFTIPAALLQVGPYQIQMPMDWSIIIGDKHVGDLELLEIKKINDRDFEVFTFNPITGYSSNFYDISIIDIYPDIKWHIPKLGYGHILTIPLGNKNQWPKVRGRENFHAPDCLFAVRDTNKLPEALDISKIL